jgi:hypothetical protein
MRNLSKYSYEISKSTKSFKFTIGLKKQENLEKLTDVKGYRKNLRTNRRKTQRKRKELKINSYFLKKLVLKKVKRGIKLTEKMIIEGKNTTKIKPNKAATGILLMKLNIFKSLLKNQKKCS